MGINRSQLLKAWTFYGSINYFNSHVGMILTGTSLNNKIKLYYDTFFPNDDFGLRGRKFLVSTLEVRF